MATVTYKCPNCGGELTFSPEKQSFVCAYCDGVFTRGQLEESYGRTADESEESAARETAGGDTAQGESPDTDGAFLNDALRYVCGSCGAEILTDDTTAATFCYYCQNPVVLAGRVSGELKPDFVLPFTQSKVQAQGYFKQWCKGKVFIDRKFVSSSRLEKLTGVYIPFWTADSDVHVEMDGTASTVRTWRKGDREFTEVSRFAVGRRGDAVFRDITVRALRRYDEIKVNGVQPFDLSAAKPFDMAYLSGFLAERRNIEREEAGEEYEERCKKYSNQLVRDTVTGYSEFTEHSFSADVRLKNWRYMLLPVWVLTYKFKDELYYFTMNGQTGRICGRAPLDKPRLRLTCAGIAAGIFALLTLGGVFLW